MEGPGGGDTGAAAGHGDAVVHPLVSFQSLPMTPHGKCS